MYYNLNEIMIKIMICILVIHIYNNSCEFDNIKTYNIKSLTITGTYVYVHRYL